VRSSTAEVTLRFIAPNGYPAAAPDCFWVEPNLSMNGGSLPAERLPPKGFPKNNRFG
jgi:hypothetical protein